MASNTNIGNWASLSKDIVFFAPQSPVELMYKPTVPNFVDQPLLVGKPRTQKVGLELKEIKITLKFHLFIMPFNKLKAALTLAAANGTILTWVWGNGQVLGNFVIRNWEEKPKKTDETGQTFVIDIEITLKEYAGSGVKAQQAQAAKQQAFAVSTAEVRVSGLPVPPQVVNPVEDVSEGVAAVNSNVSKLDAFIAKLQSAQMTLQTFKSIAQQYLNETNKYITQINNAVTLAQNIKNGSNIQSAANTLGVAVTTMLTTAQNPALATTVAQFVSMFNTISGYTDLLNQANAEADVVKSWFAPLRIAI